MRAHLPPEETQILDQLQEGKSAFFVLGRQVVSVESGSITSLLKRNFLLHPSLVFPFVSKIEVVKPKAFISI